MVQSVLALPVLLAAAYFPRMMKTVGQLPTMARRALNATNAQVYSTPKRLPHTAVVWACHGIRLVLLGDDGVTDEHADIHTGQTHSFVPSHL